MLAADLVFLSADKESFIGSDKSWGVVGFSALIFLMASAFCSLLSIMISRKGTYRSAWSSFGLMKLYHDRRRRWLSASAWLKATGALIYLGAMIGPSLLATLQPMIHPKKWSCVIAEICSETF